MKIYYTLLSDRYEIIIFICYKTQNYKTKSQL